MAKPCFIPKYLSDLIELESLLIKYQMSSARGTQIANLGSVGRDEPRKRVMRNTTRKLITYGLVGAAFAGPALAQSYPGQGALLGGRTLGNPAYMGGGGSPSTAPSYSPPQVRSATPQISPSALQPSFRPARLHRSILSQRRSPVPRLPGLHPSRTRQIIPLLVPAAIR